MVFLLNFFIYVIFLLIISSTPSAFAVIYAKEFRLENFVKFARTVIEIQQPISLN